MNVSGIRPYEEFYQYNSAKIEELRNQRIAETNLLRNEAEEPAIARTDYEDMEVGRQTANQSFSSYDYARLYQADDTFNLKGNDSDINSLDTEKALSDLNKDQVLQQYQYFVGDRQRAAQTAAISRTGENFSL